MAISIKTKSELISDDSNKLYELVMLFRSNVITHDIQNDLSSIASVITMRVNGFIINSEYWGLRPLSYEISGNKKAHYYFFALKMPSSSVQKVSNFIKNNSNIIRYMFIASESDEKTLKDKSVMLKNLTRDMEKEMGEIVFNESNVFKV